MQFVLRNIETGRTYKIISWDRETNEITLQGEFSQFTEKFDKEAFKRWGYRLEKEPTEADETEDA